MLRFEFESKTFQLFYFYPLYHVESHVCLSRGVHVASAS
jgi:hypothetical protein